MYNGKYDIVVNVLNSLNSKPADLVFNMKSLLKGYFKNKSILNQLQVKITVLKMFNRTKKYKEYCKLVFFNKPNFVQFKNIG